MENNSNENPLKKACENNGASGGINYIGSPSSMEEYLKTLSEKEYKAYWIAKELLGMSFDLKKSKGYVEYYNNRFK